MVLPAYNAATAADKYLQQYQPTIEKGLGKHYRFSCWVKSNVAATLTIHLKNDATLQATGQVSYSTLNQWQYL